MMMSDEVKEKDVLGSTNALVWAKYFVQVVQDNPKIALDVATMTTWFAGAIESGRNKVLLENLFKEHNVKNMGEYVSVVLLGNTRDE